MSRSWPTTTSYLPGSRVVGDRSLHVDQKTFAAQLDWIRRRAEVVPLSKIYHAASESRLRVVITFDDAYRGTMTAGLAELGERGMPATVFVPTGLLGGDGFWWDRLASGSGPLDPGVRNYVMNQLQGDGDRAVAWAREQGVSVVDVPAHARPVTEEELLSARMPGLTLGAHTVTHANLPSLGADAIRSEMTASKDWAQEPHGPIHRRAGLPLRASRRCRSSCRIRCLRACAPRGRRLDGAR